MCLRSTRQGLRRQITYHLRALSEGHPVASPPFPYQEGSVISDPPARPRRSANWESNVVGKWSVASEL